MNKKELLIHKIAAKYIANESLDIELKGKPAEIDALHSLLEVSKKLKIALDDDNFTLDEVFDLLNEKKNATEKFTNLTGIIWRL